MDHVPIRPRFNDEGPALVVGAQPLVQQQAVQSAVQSAAPVQQAVQQAVQQPPQKGLFTSVYDNKLIVLIIAIIIIIIALAAYVIFRKDETAEVPKPKPRRNNYPQDNIDDRNRANNNAEGEDEDGNNGGNNNNGGNRENTKEAASKNNTVKSAANTEAAKQQDLQKLLARGRAAATASVENKEPVVEEYDDAKTENEILKLMEDDTPHDVSTTTDVQDDTHTEIADEPLNTPTADATQTTQDKPTTAQSTTPTLDPNKCSSIVKDRQCGNKPTRNGKCHVHVKSN